MTTRAAIIWFVLAVALALGAALTGQNGAPGSATVPPPSRLLLAAINDSTSLRMHRSGQAAINMIQDRADGTWLVSREGGREWPVEPGRIPALLRVLSGTTGTIERSREVSADATTLEFHASDPDPIASIRVDAASLAGRTLVEAIEQTERRTMLIDDAFKRAIAGAGPMSWRDRRVFPGLPSDVSRITIRMPTHTIALARQSGRWGIRSPIVARAEASAVASVIRAMQSMELNRFIDDETDGAAPTFPDRTQVALDAEADGVDPRTGERWTLRWQLDLGGVAPKGGTFFARLQRTALNSPHAAYGPVVVELSNDRLASVPAAVEAYIARTVLDVPASDIGVVQLALPGGPTTFYRRTTDGWLTSDPTGTSPGIELVESDRRQIESLLTITCQARADHVAILDGEDSLPGGLDATFLGLSEQPLEACSVFIDDGTERPQLIVRSGRVTRAYYITEELAEWISSR